MQLPKVSQQTHQCRIIVETTLINVDVWLKLKDESTYVYQRCINVEMRLSFLR